MTSILRNIVRAWTGRNARVRRKRSNPRSLRFPVAAEVLEDRQLLAGVVPLSSMPVGADATIHLDFDGHFEAQWGNQPYTENEYHNVSTPAFDLDNNPNDFSVEQAFIIEVFERVKEDFSSFKINVTTVDPGQYYDGTAVRVAIGGNWDDWYHEDVGGVALTGSFVHSQLVNTVYAFQYDWLDQNGNPINKSAKDIADTASHEVGHAFNLKHHVDFDPNGQPIPDTYWDGTGMWAPPDAGSWAPLMGDTDNAERSTWWSNLDVSQQVSGLTPQGDMQVISGWNGIGWVDDDHGNTIQTATPWNTAFTTYGIIRFHWSDSPSGLGDADYFHVNPAAYLPGAKWKLNLDVNHVGPNLNAKVEIYDADGNLIAVDDPSDKLGASLTVSPGEYYLAVKSHGNYGDVGQYSLSLTVEIPDFGQNAEEHPPFWFPLCDPERLLVEDPVFERIDVYSDPVNTKYNSLPADVEGELLAEGDIRSETIAETELDGARLADADGLSSETKTLSTDLLDAALTSLIDEVEETAVR